MLAAAISAALLVPVFAAAPVANAAPNGAPWDFDGNGQADMAVWVPGELVAHKTNAGAVNVIYGRKGGLSRKNNQFWTQGSNGVQDSPEIDDRFGATLASGDFNNDNRADLAIGVPGEDVNGVSDAGAVEVIYGTPNGLRVTLEQFFTQETPGIGGFPRPEDLFAGALASGDFNGDGFDDLVVGSPGEDVNGKAAAGSIVVIYGSGAGLDPAVSDEWTQTTSGAGQTQAGDRFGAALAVADFGSGTRDDLAIGVPREKVRKKDSAGAVVAMYGAATGLDPTGHQLWDQGGRPLQSDPGAGDRFGSTLAAGNLGHGSTNDLAVGIPGENKNSGGVGVIFGKPSGLAGEKDELWTQATRGIPGDPGSDHCFGCALAIGNVGMGSLRDLAIGARGQRIGKGQRGRVHLVRDEPGPANQGAPVLGQADQRGSRPGHLLRFVRRVVDRGQLRRGLLRRHRHGRSVGTGRWLGERRQRDRAVRQEERPDHTGVPAVDAGLQADQGPGRAVRRLQPGPVGRIAAPAAA